MVMEEEIVRPQREALSGELSAEEFTKLRAEQTEILRAFQAKHGCDADSVGVDIRSLGNGRVLWSVRKLSKAEREVKRLAALKRDVAAMAKAEEKTFAFVPGKVKWWLRPFRPAAVYLSEKGARTASDGSGVTKVEVLA